MPLVIIFLNIFPDQLKEELDEVLSSLITSEYTCIKKINLAYKRDFPNIQLVSIDFILNDLQKYSLLFTYLGKNNMYDELANCITHLKNTYNSN